MIRALDTLSFGLCLLGWLLLGVFGTWTETAPFWIGAPLLWAAALCGLFTLHWGLRGRLSRTCLVSVILFTAYVMWRALRSEVDYLARHDVVFGATAFIGWVLTAARYEKPRHRFALIVVWALLILGNLGMGLYQLRGNPAANPLEFLKYTRDYGDAVFGGFFPNSNHLCGFVELTAFILLAIWLYGRVHSFVRVLCGLVFLAACACVALSTSRGGFLAFGAGALVFGTLAGLLHLLRKRERRARWQVTAALFGAITIVILAAGAFGWSQLESKFGEGEVFKNLNFRTDLWERAYEQWHQSPLVGTGARSYEYYERSFRDLATPWVWWNETDVDAVFAHNDWVQTLADYGLLGLLLAAAVLLIHCWKSLSFLLAESHGSKGRGGGFFPDHRGAIVLGALCGLITFAIHCAADFQMHVGVNAVLAASVLGLMANPGAPAAEAETPEATAPCAARITATVAAAIPAAALAWCFVPWAIGDYNFYSALGTYNRAVEDPADYFTALAKMEGSVEADPKNYQAWTYWGNAETGSANLLPVLEQQFLTKAFDRYHHAYRLYPQNPEISTNMAVTLDRLGRFAEAEGWFLKALAWGNGSRFIHWKYAYHLAATGRYAEAIEHYEAVVEKHGRGGRKRTEIQKQLDRARELLKKQHEAKPAPLPAPAAPPNQPK